MAQLPELGNHKMSNEKLILVILGLLLLDAGAGSNVS